jgi:PAS domain S-box-containing protein
MNAPDAAPGSPAEDRLLYNLALGVAGVSGSNVFESIVRYLAATLGVDLAFVGRLLAGHPAHVQTVAVCLDGAISDNLEYDLAQSPCREVVGRACFYVRHGVEREYAGDNMLSALGLTGYAGAPLNDSAGRPLGVIAVLHRGPLPERSRVETVLSIFAARAAAELERLAADEARRQSEASYQAIFEAAEDCIFVHDLDTGAILDVNPKACSTYGYTREEFLGLNPGDLGSGEPPYTLEGAAAWIEQARREGPVRVEWHRRNKDGSLHWDEVFIKHAVIGGVERLLAITRDIGERKAAEDALRASEERYHTIFNASVDGLALCTHDGRVTEANPAFCRLFGATREQLLAAESFQFVHPDSKLRCWQFFEAASAGQSLQSEARAQRSDGSFFDVEVHGVPVHYGNEPHLLLIMRDITDRREAESQRAQLESQLRQAQKMEAIGHLAGGIAHDFNNILTSLMGYVTMVSEALEGRGEAQLARHLERAAQSGRRARDLIQQLLTFSRGQRGAARPLFLAPLVDEAMKLLAASLPSSVVLLTEFEDGLPPVMLDPVQVEQVLMNLCINGADAMDGRGVLRISLRHADIVDGVCASCRKAAAGSFVELAVSNEGCGIAPGTMERIFEPFYTTKETGKGSGMGLATVHGIVHEAGGHILVDSAPGHGTAFRVLLPALAGVAATAAMPSDASEGAGRRPALQGRVLLVDDEASVAEFMQDLLSAWGLTVRALNNPVAARDAFAQAPHAFDLVLLDQTMPGLTGLELAQDMLLLRPELPVILYTGYREALDDETVRKIGVRAVVRKPVDSDALHALLTNYLSGRT